MGRRCTYRKSFFAAMIRPLAIAIGLRYTRARRRTQFISFITWISIVGIGLGVTALITVLSVMNGFEKELTARILGMASHATITDVNNRLNNWEKRAASWDTKQMALAVREANKIERKRQRDSIEEYRKANVDGLRTHALADFDAEVQAASTTRLGGVRDHHGADKHDEAEGDLPAFVCEQM